MAMMMTRRSLGMAVKSFAAPVAMTRFFSSSMADGTDEEMAMYTLGVNVASKVSEVKDQLNKEELDRLVAGFGDAIHNKVSNEQELYTKYGPIISKILGERAAKAADGNVAAGKQFIEKYLAENPTAVETGSGLVYHSITEGTGKSPLPTDTVLVHYHGTLTSGKTFDSSIDRGEPIEFPLNGVIKGWTEGVGMMKAGGKSILVCPADLAYGDNGSPPVILPGSTLVFSVELLEIK